MSSLVYALCFLFSKCIYIDCIYDEDISAKYVCILVFALLSSSPSSILPQDGTVSAEASESLRHEGFVVLSHHHRRGLCCFVTALSLLCHRRCDTSESNCIGCLVLHLHTWLGRFAEQDLTIIKQWWEMDREADAKANNLRNCVVMRLGEKQVLRHYSELFYLVVNAVFGTGPLPDLDLSSDLGDGSGVLRTKTDRDSFLQEIEKWDEPAAVYGREAIASLLPVRTPG